MKLNGILVKDRMKDSLFYIEKLQLKLLTLDREEQRAVLGQVVMDKTLVNFRQRVGEPDMNYQFLVDLSRKGEGGGGVWNILFNNLKINDGTFRYKIDGKAAPVDWLFDENDFAFNQINLELKDFYLVGDSLDFKIKNLSTIEKNGLPVKRLVCKAKVHSTGMEYSEMELKTKSSTIQDFLAFDYSSFRSFRYFLDSVYVRTRLENTQIATTDLTYFSHNLKPYEHNHIGFTGRVRGYVGNFKAKDFVLSVGKESLLAGDLDLKGLPNWRSSFIKLKVRDLKSSASDVERIMNLELQDKLHHFNKIQFQGHLTGFYTDFAADGVLESALGKLTSRINFKLDSDEYAEYTGKLDAEDFDLGTFLGNNQLGRTSFTFDLNEGHGLTFEKLRTRFESNVEYFEYNGSVMKNIRAEGLYTDQFFDGKAWFNDPSLDFTFNGKVNLKPAMPTFDFVADIKNIDLKRLKLDSAETQIGAKLDIKLTGNDPDNIYGFANLSDIKVRRNSQKLQVTHLNLESSFSDSTRKLAVQSDLINGQLEGKFSLNNLNQVYHDFLHTLFPEFHDSVSLDHEVEALGYFEVKENDLISYWTDYDVKLGEGKLKINYNTREESLEASGKFDFVEYDEYNGKNTAFVVQKRPHQLLNLSADVAVLMSDTQQVVDNILLNASVLPNHLEFLLDFADTTDLFALRSFGSLDFSDDTVRVEFEESQLYLDQKPWQIVGVNSAVYTQDRVEIENLLIQRGNQMLSLKGVVSDNKGDRLLINTQNLDLANFNPILSPIGFSLGGVSNDSIKIYQILRRPFIHGDLSISNLAVNGDTLGDFSIKTTSEDDPLVMWVEIKVKKGLLKDIEADGQLDLSSEKGKIQMQVIAKNASIKPMEVFFDGIASNFAGVVDGQMMVSGTVGAPKFKGLITAKDVSVKVDYLNTTYSVNDNIGLSSSSIDFKNLKVKDERGSTATVKGSIKHDLFEDMVLDIQIDDVNNLMVLNTTARDNDVFYGTGFATGKASFKGPIDDLVIDIKAKTNKGSKLTIPIYEESDNDLVEYISFKKVNIDTNKVVVIDPAEQQKMTMNFDFDITDDVEFVLLFDEVLDDKIKGRGYGNIKMNYATGEDFYMYGVYNITEGIYPFSSPTLVSEKFDIREGGQIVWNGDPYNAKINLQAAVARNRANPLDLMAGLVDGSNEEYNTNIRMNVILNLKGELFSPDVTFGWEFPEVATSSRLSEFNTLVKKIETDPDELNRQVFSLLTFGSFTPASNYGVGIGATASSNDYRDIVSSSIGTFLSNQVNNWISEYDQNWEFGVDYLTKSGITDQERAELIFSARRKLMNERVELAASYNANSSSSRNPYNVDLVYKVKKDGSLKLKAYHKLANDPTLGDVSNVSTTGIGFYFRRQFDRIRLRKKKVQPE